MIDLTMWNDFYRTDDMLIVGTILDGIVNALPDVCTFKVVMYMMELDGQLNLYDKWSDGKMGC